MGKVTEGFKHLSIRSKIILSFSIFVVAYGFVAALNLVLIANITDLTKSDVPRIAQISELQLFGVKLEQLDRQTDELFSSSGGADYDEVQALMSELLRHYEQIFDNDIDNLDTVLASELHTVLRSLDASIKGFTVLKITQQDQILANRIQVEIFNDVRRAKDFYRAYTDLVIASMEDNSVEEQAFLEKITQQLLLSGFLFMVLGLVLSLILSRIFMRPVTQLEATAREISNGNLNAKAPVYAKDEFGQLAEAINMMVEKLLEAQKLPENILRSMKDGLLVVDDDGVIREVNESALKLLGYTEKELIGSFLDTVFADIQKNKNTGPP